MGPGPTDAELAARVVASDDRHAFAQLVRRHQSAVRTVLLRLCAGDAAAADDLAQETFVRAWRGLRSWQGGARLSTWLHRVAVNAWISQARRRGPAPVATAAEAEWETGAGEGAADPGGIADAAPPAARAAEARHDLARAFAVLRDEERLALALAYAQDLTHEEAAEAAGWPVGTLKTHLARGKEKLRRRLVPGEGAA